MTPAQELSAEKDQDRVTKDVLERHVRLHEANERVLRERIALRGGKQADNITNIGVGPSIVYAAATVGRRASIRFSQLMASAQPPVAERDIEMANTLVTRNGERGSTSAQEAVVDGTRQGTTAQAVGWDPTEVGRW